MTSVTNYRIGIDVGANSVGFAAVQVLPNGNPVVLLNGVAQIHDAGVDPDKKKAAVTRLASAGGARRTRRLIQRRRKRLKKIDAFLLNLGCPISNPESWSNPYTPWIARAQLAERPLDEPLRSEYLSIAIRHIARHRGWRNPYSTVKSLHIPSNDSDQLIDFKHRVSDKTGISSYDGFTVGQVVNSLVLAPSFRLRDAGNTTYSEMSVLDGVYVGKQEKTGILGGKLMQSDNANEIRKICDVQGIGEAVTNQLIDLVFESRSPKGSAGKRAGKDDLPGQQALIRAPRSHLAFQEFRITAFIANIRVKSQETKEKRILTQSERSKLREMLMNPPLSDVVTWEDIASCLGVNRADLSGVADRAENEDRVSSFPPVNVTAQRILQSGIQPLVNWWKQNDSLEIRSAMVTAISNADELDENSVGGTVAIEFLESQSPEILEKIDKLTLPSGRASYSTDSLERLTRRMQTDCIDLFDARMDEFSVSKNWRPSTPPIGEPVGNPAVDRVLRIVDRWLRMAIATWGAPISINIEHVRSAFGSEAAARAYEKETERRQRYNAAAVEGIAAQFGIESTLRRSEITRVLALRRQNSQCAYCGTAITFNSAEMDHILPRKGPGSNNSRANLVAVCRRCNQSKSDLSFAVWAARTSIEEVSLELALERTRFWLPDPALDRKQNANFLRDVRARFERKEDDEPIDGRSFESLAWMARELRSRIVDHFEQIGDVVMVNVFRGAITAEARRSTGLELRVELIGDRGKTRLDRRHHVIDAAVIALLSPSVAQVLAERISIRESQRLTMSHETWKEYWGDNHEAQSQTARWRANMNQLCYVLRRAVESDSIPVSQNLRLKLGNGEAHEATIRKFSHKVVGESWTIDEIDRASTEQLWCALSQQADFDPRTGLPELSDREIRVKNTWLNAADTVAILPKKIAAIPVRGGYAKIGNSIHHARFYKIQGGTQFGMVRVFAHDLHKARNEDLFSAELKPQSISLRTADPKVRRAILEGTADYLGWLVSGDELYVQMPPSFLEEKSIAPFLEDFPRTVHWRIAGFEDSSRINLRPSHLAKEGLARADKVSSTSQQIIGDKTWRISVNKLLSNCEVRAVRRDSLGRERESSTSGLPVSYYLNPSRDQTQ
ncbi:type II CRISPR RNA-guided endonuclease Cas9 [Actinomycetaceae bacterium L2_0104]